MSLQFWMEIKTKLQITWFVWRWLSRQESSIVWKCDLFWGGFFPPLFLFVAWQSRACHEESNFMFQWSGHCPMTLIAFLWYYMIAKIHIYFLFCLKGLYLSPVLSCTNYISQTSQIAPALFPQGFKQLVHFSVFLK